LEKEFDYLNIANSKWHSFLIKPDKFSDSGDTSLIEKHLQHAVKGFG